MRGSNRRKFTRQQCRIGGSRTKGYETEEEHRQRQLMDSKGLVLRRGVSYTSDNPSGVPWSKRRALLGRVDQIEITLGEGIVKTCGETRLTGKWAFLRGK